MLKTVCNACKLHKMALDFSLAEQIKDLGALISQAGDGAAFFEKNYVTAGMRQLFEMGLRRLAGRSDQAVFELTQAMGGGKTHTSWWEELTSRGGEGMVVKPMDFVARGRRGVVQPAVKCRGAEYLRIIYGIEYTVPENLDRLRARRLSVKRSLALREFALGIEGLERFVRKEPLRRVHECVFGVLALESEPVDPRL